MNKFRPAVQRGITKVADRMRAIRAESSGTLADDQQRTQWEKYSSLPLADRAVWVSRRVRTQSKDIIEGEMIRFEDEMGRRYGSGS